MKNSPTPLTNDNLFLAVPDTNFRELVEETLMLINYCPDILSSIEADQDAHALQKKKMRIADEEFRAEQILSFPKLCDDKCDATSQPSSLHRSSPLACGKSPDFFDDSGIFRFSQRQKGVHVSL